MSTDHKRADSSFDELSRAAAAAGFAMAAPDDDFPRSESRQPATVAISVEELARGARRGPAASDAAAEVLAARTTSPEAGKGLLASANSVRETVFGYLRLSVPA